MEAKRRFDCAERGDVDFFKTAALDILLMPRDTDGYTVLHEAAMRGHLDCCEVIVQRCPQLLYHFEGDDNWSILHSVAAYRGDNNLESILGFLITAASKPDLERCGGRGNIRNKRLLTMQNIDGLTALHLAVIYGNHWATKLLLEADRDFELLRMIDPQGRTCLHIAAMEGDRMSAELITKARPDTEFLKMTKLPEKQTALHIAVENKNLAIVQMLLEAGNSNDLMAVVDSLQHTALHYAVEQGDLGMVKLMCKAGFDEQLLRMPCSHEDTPFNYAMAAANDTSSSDWLVICKLLLEKLPNEHTKQTGGMGWAPLLHLAASSGFDSIVKDIIRLCPACIHTVDFHGRNVLHKAAYHGRLDVVQHFLKSKDTDVVALLNAQDKDGCTPIHSAICGDSGVICKLLLEKDPSQCLKKERGEGWTLLHLAASYGRYSVVKDIIRLFPDCINTVDFHGQNGLHKAAYYGHRGVAHYFLESKDTDVVALLNTQDKNGNTPLHLAAFSGNVEVVGLLLKAQQISIHIANISEQTPYMMAMEKIFSDGDKECSRRDLKIIRMLLEKDPEQCKIRTGDMGWTYLQHAASGGYLNIIYDIIQLCPDCAKLEDAHKQTFVHIAVKHGFVNVVRFILGSKEIETPMLNAQDKDGNTPLHIGALNKSQDASLCLLYDDRVNKGIENDKKEKAIDLIDFPYDEAKARVYSLGHQRDLKDQSSFDLLVATLIATVSFAAGITVPGGYVSDGANKGSAILLKAIAFKVFIVSNNFALLFSLYTVFLNFSTRRLLKEEDIYYESSMGTFRTRLLLKKKDMIYQLNVATLCTLSAIYAMVVAFITGSYAVLANSDGLAITVCVSSCFFLILASHAMWTMAMHYWRSKAVLKVSS